MFRLGTSSAVGELKQRRPVKHATKTKPAHFVCPLSKQEADKLYYYPEPAYDRNQQRIEGKIVKKLFGYSLPVIAGWLKVNLKPEEFLAAKQTLERHWGQPNIPVAPTIGQAQGKYEELVINNSEYESWRNVPNAITYDEFVAEFPTRKKKAVVGGVAKLAKIGKAKKEKKAKVKASILRTSGAGCFALAPTLNVDKAMQALDVEAQIKKRAQISKKAGEHFQQVFANNTLYEYSTNPEQGKANPYLEGARGTILVTSNKKLKFTSVAAAQ